LPGQFTWYGLVLVLGDITFTGGSGIHIWGCVLTQGGMTSRRSPATPTFSTRRSPSSA
jgi:hypothetical protein